MEPAKVLVVDDSSVVRRLVAEVVNADPDLTVVSTATNGREALERIEEFKPDIITLDIEMPEMDGLAALRELNKVGPMPPVVMLSSLTASGSSATLEALALGASDYVAKPAHAGSIDAARTHLKTELLPKLKGLARRTSLPMNAEQGAAASTRLRQGNGFDNRQRPIEAIVIASSTGGPAALETVLSSFRGPPRVPIFIVQHIPTIFSARLAKRLDERCPLSVVEASDGELARPGTAYLAPGGRHMRLAKRPIGATIQLADDEPINFCRPAADVLFKSAVEVHGGGLLAVVLTGMGHDGRDGCELVCAAGGSVLVQDEASSVIWGMPGAVAKAGLANELQPLRKVATRIEDWLTRHAQPVGVGQ